MAHIMEMNVHRRRSTKAPKKKAKKCVDDTTLARDLSIKKYLEDQHIHGESSPIAEENNEDLVISLTHQVVEMYIKFERDIEGIVRKISQAATVPSTAICAIEALNKKLGTKKANYFAILTSMLILRKKYRDKMLELLTENEEKIEAIDKIYDAVAPKIEIEKPLQVCSRHFNEAEAKMARLKQIIEMDKIEVILNKNINDLELYENYKGTLAVTSSGALTIVKRNEIDEEESEKLVAPTVTPQSTISIEKLDIICEEESVPLSMVQSTEEETTDISKSVEEAYYLKEVLGKPLTMALAEIIIRQPRDPIQYLAHWLMKYRYNRSCSGIIDENQIDVLISQREVDKRNKLLRILELEAKNVIDSAISRAEQIGSENIRQRLARALELQLNEEAQRALLRELERIHQEQMGLEQ